MRLMQLTLFIVLLQIVKHVEMLSCGERGPNVDPSNYWPWHAAIFDKTNESISPIYRCGGTLVTSNWILTAGQCVYSNNVLMEPAMVSVSLGLNELSGNKSTTQSLEVVEVIPYPGFNSTDYTNDIALIRLSSDATINDYVRPICLWPSSEKELSRVVGKDGTMIGWGQTETGERLNEIQQDLLSVVTSFECLRSNRNFFGSYLTETNYCAGHRHGTNVWLADAGGSMSFDRNGKHYIRGIVSVVPSKQYLIAQKVDCGHCGSIHYAVFTDVAQYLQWIIEKTLIYCEAKAQCDMDWYYYGICRITLPVKNFAPHCVLTLDHDTNPDIRELVILGETEKFPDLWDAFHIFQGFKTVNLGNIKLKSVNFNLPSIYLRIMETLFINYNQITELHVDTFKKFENLKVLEFGNNRLKELPDGVFYGPYNLESINLESNQLETLPTEIFRYNRNLYHLFLSKNLLKELHADQFKQNRNLETLDLSNNQLEILPQGLFRNNGKLKDVRLDKNKIKKIECDFDNMPGLIKLNFGGNVCIDENCDGPTFCGTSSSDEMNKKIKSNCTAD